MRLQQMLLNQISFLAVLSGYVGRAYQAFVYVHALVLKTSKKKAQKHLAPTKPSLGWC